MLFLSNLYSTNSVSEYPIKFIDNCLENYNPKVCIPFKYFKILLIAFKCDSLGLD